MWPIVTTWSFFMDMETIRLLLMVAQVLIAPVIGFMVHRLMQAQDRNQLAITGMVAQLAEFKLKVAEDYVTNSTLTKTIDQLGKSFDAFVRKLEQTETKLDRLIERNVQ